MDTQRLSLRFLSLFIILLLFISCSIYQKSSVNIEEAVSSNTKVKIVTIDERKAFYKKLEKQENVLYGWVGNRKVELNEEGIKEIHLKDKSRSTLATIAIPVVVVGVAIGVFSNSVNNMDIEL